MPLFLCTFILFLLSLALINLPTLFSFYTLYLSFNPSNLLSSSTVSFGSIFFGLRFLFLLISVVFKRRSTVVNTGYEVYVSIYKRFCKIRADFATFTHT